MSTALVVMEPIACAYEPCGTVFTPRSAAAKYCCSSHRTAAWKARTAYSDRRRPRPSRNAAKRRSKPPAPRISYAKAVEAVAISIRCIVSPPTDEKARAVAAEVLEPCLSPAGRKAVGA